MELLYRGRTVRFSFDPTRVITTLGPEGTSSWASARALSDAYGGEILLSDSYETAKEKLPNLAGKGVLVVANAYKGINQFYISVDLIPVFAFFHKTPPYVLAAKCPECLQRPNLRVATHHAPSHMIHGAVGNANISIIDSPSTRNAADMVIDSEADACITTRTCADMLGLRSLKTLFDGIPMLWTAFGEKATYGQEVHHHP